MLNEPSGLSDSPVIEIASSSSPANDLRTQLRNVVDDVFFVDFESDDLSEPITASYTGHLSMDSMAAYDKLDAAFKPLDHVPVMLEENGQQVIRAVRGRIHPRPRPTWPNALLFGLTILSVLFAGAVLGGVQATSPLDILQGWPYAVSLLLILGSHELGHYFAARYHKVAVTLPYFIPMPLSLFGTMGAFIQLREPMRNRRILLDIGAAGPLVGLVVAIPILLVGLKTSPVLPLPTMDVFLLKTHMAGYIAEGNSILYMLAKFVVFGHFLPDGMKDVTINQLTWAGWTGLLVTALNLIPVGQLDGGHVIYSLIGERARILFIPLIAALGLLSIFFQEWLLWVVLLLVLGRVYATPLDSITRLDTRRRVIAIIALVMFILVFMPVPLQQIVVGSRF